MIISTTKPIKILKKTIISILVAAFWIFIWEATSRIVSRDNELMLLILPSPFTVFDRWLAIAFTKPYLTAVGSSLVRIISGFLLGVLAGIFLGITTHCIKTADIIFSPIIKMIRAIPVVAISILLFLFFESDTLPVCIVCLMVMPVIWQTVYDGLNTPDKKLMEMAKVFELGTIKTFFYIKVPGISYALISSSVNALGLAWKSGIAAEVISLPKKSLGTALWQSKGSIEFAEVYAVTLTVVILSIVIEFLLKSLIGAMLKKAGDVK